MKVDRFGVPEAMKFANPNNYRGLQWDGQSCVHLISERQTEWPYDWYFRLCRYPRGKGYGPDGLLCKRHAKWHYEREALMEEFEPRINEMLANMHKQAARRPRVVMPLLQEGLRRRS